MAETPMVEAVARAIVAAPNPFVEGVDTEPNYCALEQARAAIGAMRMTHLPGDGMDIINAKRTWNAGIDAALAAPDEGQSP